MDVNNGEVLAMASSPTFDPNSFANGVSAADMVKMNDEIRRPMFNRATFRRLQSRFHFQNHYRACLSGIRSGSGRNPRFAGLLQTQARQAEYQRHRRPGGFDLKRAFYKSSNAYFITNGMQIRRRSEAHGSCETFSSWRKDRIETPEVPDTCRPLSKPPNSPKAISPTSVSARK